MKKLALTLALTAAFVQPASAFFITCSEYRAAILSGDDLILGGAIGHSFGTADMLAGLLCFVNDRRCRCLSNLDAGDFGGAIGRAISSCPGGDPVFGVEFNAALSLCR